ncbi:hypothetical protein [Postechiella marina]
MKKIIYSICLLTFVLALSSCEKDLLDDVNEGNWNNERNILEIGLAQQIGLSRIERTDTQAIVSITVNANGLDLSAVDITDMVLSYDAEANVAKGDKLNFDNEEKKASINVTSKQGESLEWVIYVEPFINQLEGSWSISSFYFKWDDGFGWGNAGEAELPLLLPNANAGLDDVIMFGAVEGANEDGLVYGNYERTTGDDGEAGTFVYDRTSADWADRFKHLPVGSGQWILNKDNSIMIVVEGTTYTTKIFELIDNSTLKIPLNPGAQDLGKINWDDYYGDHTNKFVASADLWYTLNKL